MRSCPPYEQTAALCGLRFLPPLILHGAHGVSRDTLAQHTDTYRERLTSDPAWAGLPPPQAGVTHEVPVADRAHLDARATGSTPAPEST